MTWKCTCESLTVDVVRLDAYKKLELENERLKTYNDELLLHIRDRIKKYNILSARLAECEAELKSVYNQLKENTLEAHKYMDDIYKSYWFPYSKTMSLPNVVKTVKEVATLVVKQGINPKYFEKWGNSGK